MLPPEVVVRFQSPVEAEVCTEACVGLWAAVVSRMRERGGNGNIRSPAARLYGVVVGR
jgi:hypothetical protein